MKNVSFYPNQRNVVQFQLNPNNIRVTELLIHIKGFIVKFKIIRIIVIKLLVPLQNRLFHQKL